MKTFKMLDGYEAEYELILKIALVALVDKKRSAGVTFKEDNMIFQLRTHLGIDTNLLSQQEAAVPQTKDIGIESYN